MPTLIHVRGKRRKKRPLEASQVPPQRRVRARPQPVPLPRYLPSLNKLPTEIIQEIFSYGTNFELPLVSLELYRSLTSRAVKAKLISRLLTQQSDALCDGAQQPWSTALTDRFAHVGDDLAAIHSALLRQRFVNYDFLGECQWQVHAAWLRRKYRSFLQDLPLQDALQHLEELESAFKRNFEMGRAYGGSEFDSNAPELHQKPPKLLDPLYSYARKDGIVFEVFAPDFWGFNTLAIISIRGIESQRSTSWESQAFPSFATTTEIPSRLLRGPWTQQQGNFLTQVLWAIHKQDSSRTTSPVLLNWADASDGLEDAIRERCIPAIRRLLGSQGDANGAHEVLTAESNALAATESHALPRLNDYHPLAVDADDVKDSAVSLDGLGPWRAVNEPRLPSFMPWMGVIPERRHIELLVLEGPLGEVGVAMMRWLVSCSVMKNDLQAISDLLLRAKFTTDDPVRRSYIENLESAAKSSGLVTRSAE